MTQCRSVQIELAWCKSQDIIELLFKLFLYFISVEEGFQELQNLEKYLIEITDNEFNEKI